MLVLQDFHFGTLGGTSLPLISSAKKVNTTKTMTSKMSQVAHVNKRDDKIVITQVTHSTYTGLMTHRKAKLTTILSVKLASEHTRLLKTVGTHDSYQLVITLASLRVKGQSSS